MSSLVIQSGTQKGKKLALPEGKEIVVGRDEACQIRLASSLVSRKHCALRPAPEGLWVRDLASQNGTFVNDAAIDRPMLLTAGDLLRIGSTVFQVAGQKPPPAQPPTSTGVPATPSVSDNLIADWLSDDEIPVIQQPGDTTILSPSPPAAPQPDEVPGDASTPELPTTAVDKAAEVIRRHWTARRKPS